MVIPYFLLKRERKVLVFLINLLFVATGCLLIAYTMDAPRPHHPPMGPGPRPFMAEFLHTFLFEGITLFLVVVFAYATRMSVNVTELRQRNLEIENRRRELELRGLKSQLNPHFLFNTLNNIYALVSIDGDKAQKGIHDLSSLLRFSIYDANQPKVDLAKEMEFLRHYVELMRLRVSESSDISVAVAENIDKTLSVPPMIIPTLVENAFKHGNIGELGAFIKIEVSMEERELVCHISNSYKEKPAAGDHHGVGLDNIRRQLKLMYPGKASLVTGAAKGVYDATLRMNL
jgi:LytS/YehU family sensor histidine kinase